MTEAVTPSHYKGMRNKRKQAHMPLIPIRQTVLDRSGVFWEELDCGHRLVAHDRERPFKRRCPYCPRRD